MHGAVSTFQPRLCAAILAWNFVSFCWHMDGNGYVAAAKRNTHADLSSETASFYTTATVAKAHADLLAGNFSCISLEPIRQAHSSYPCWASGQMHAIKGGGHAYIIQCINAVPPPDKSSVRMCKPSSGYFMHDAKASACERFSKT